MAEIDFCAIELLVLDVDGVLTDGRITLTPSGEELKSFHTHDGAGMKYWKRVGGKLAIISGRGSEVVTRRAAELGVDAVRLNIKDKLPAFEEVLAELNIPADRVAAMGDDLTDMPMLRASAYSIAPANASAELKAQAAYVTELPGGSGCVREAIEHILKRAGKWDQILARYLPDSRNS